MRCCDLNQLVEVRAGDVAAAAAGGGAYLRASKGRWWTRLPKLNMQDGLMLFRFTE